MKHRPFLQAEKLAKRFPSTRGQKALVVFEDVDFTIDQGEFVCLIGHSGCGKSTILNILAGLDRASDGYVFMDGREVTGPSLDRGVIFQNHSLLPWKTALENVCFSVRARWPRWRRSEVRAHSERFIDMVGLTPAMHRRPRQLSGGMRQRVGIARAFAIQPKLLLMDEPFGALDALTRGTIQDELLRICQATRQTVFMITHDVDEAIYLSDRILLMNQGPHARVANAVNVDLPRPRARGQIIHHPGYYAIRNRLVEFLTHQSGGTAEAADAEAADRAGHSYASARSMHDAEAADTAGHSNTSTPSMNDAESADTAGRTQTPAASTRDAALPSGSGHYVPMTEEC